MSTTKKSRAATIAAFFGKREGQTTQGLLAEIKALSDADRDELAWRSAKALGIPADQCDFPVPA